MTTRAFAAWVEPIAMRLQEQRVELAELVPAIPDQAWSRPSPNDGWTYRDLLGHLVTRDARDWHLILSAVVNKARLDPADLTAEEDVPINDRLLARVSALSIDEILEKVASDTSDLLDLMAQVGEDDRGLRQSDFPMSFGEALERLPDHERVHMEQLRTGLEG